MAKSAAVVLEAGWLSLTEVRERLEAGQSTIERRVKAGLLRTKNIPRPGRKPEKMYAAEDVQKLAEQQKQKQSQPNSRSPAPPRPPLAQSIRALLSEAAPAENRPPALPLDRKLWLTIDEAVAYSGFGRGRLEELVREGKVRAEKGGVNGAWVIQRRSLEEL